MPKGTRMQNIDVEIQKKNFGSVYIVEARFGFVDRSTICYNTFNEVTGSRTTFITLSCVPNSRLNLWNLDKKIERRN